MNMGQTGTGIKPDADRLHFSGEDISALGRCLPSETAPGENNRSPAAFWPYDAEPPAMVHQLPGQIRHLAIIGLAARGSAYNIANLEDAFDSLFEVIARLASELEDEVEA